MAAAFPGVGNQGEAGDDLEKITELEKFDPTRVDGVGTPANGFPILMMKALDVAEINPAANVAAAETQEGHIAAVMTEPDRQDAPAPAQGATKAIEAETVTVELPADVSVSFSPRDLAKLNALKRQLTAEPSVREVAKRDFDRNVGGGVDRDKIPTEDFADPEHRAFPIVTPKDVADIAPNLNHDIKGDPEKIKQRAMAIARRKGPEFEAKIPDSWKGEDVKDDDAKKDAEPTGEPAAAKAGDEIEKGKPPFKGAAKPFEGDDGSEPDDAEDEGDSDDDSAEKAQAQKAGNCSECDAPMRKSDKFCAQCGTAMKKAAKPSTADTDVERAIDRLEQDADAALAAQAKDPDATTHPADQMVAQALENVREDVQTAAAAQDKDEATDSPAAHATKSAAGPAAYHLARLHDATCAAYRADDVIAAHPAVSKGLAHIADPDVFAASISAALTAGDSASAAMALPSLSHAYSLAAVLKAADSGLMAEAMTDLRKAFADYYPDVHVKPGSITPGQFERPYVSAGRANQTAGSGQKPRIPLASHVPNPDDFKRPLITAGREAASPGSAAKDARTYYTTAAREQAKGVLAAMHDYIAGQHPGVCAMGESAHGAMGVSPAASAPVPQQFGKTNATSTPIPVDAAHAASLVTPHVTKEAEMANAANPAQEAAAPAATATAGPLIDPEMLKSTIRDLVADQFGDLTKTIGDLEARIAEFESSPDPAQMAPRSGASLTKAKHDGQEVPAGGDEAARTERLVRLVKQAKDPDQGIALPALDELMKTAGRELAVKLLS